MMLTRVSLIEACDDRGLFAFDLWPEQRRLLHTVEEGPRTHVWALGRRSSKTTLASLILLHGLLFRPDLDRLVRAGERRFAVAIAVNQRQARLLIRSAQTIVEQSPLLHELLESATEDELRFLNGTSLVAFPCSSSGARGWPISHLCFDEAAHHIGVDDGPRTLERLLSSLRPSTVQFGPEARILIVSTPFGADGTFAELHQRASRGELRDARAEHAASAEINPNLTEELLEHEREADPAMYATEFQAAFESPGESYIDLAKLDLSVGGAASPDDAAGWVCGVDIAFERDATGIALLARDSNERRRLVAGPVEAVPSIGEFARPLERVRALAEEYGARCVVDQYASPAVLDWFRQRSIPISVHKMDATSKSRIFEELRARLYSHELALYEHVDLLGEIRRLRTRYTPGQATVHNPRVGRSHGDQVQALAMAAFELKHPRARRLRVVRGGGYSVDPFGEPVKTSRWADR